MEGELKVQGEGKETEKKERPPLYGSFRFETNGVGVVTPPDHERRETAKG